MTIRSGLKKIKKGRGTGWNLNQNRYDEILDMIWNLGIGLLGYDATMKKYIMIFLLAGLLIIVYQNGVRVDRDLAEKEMIAENCELNTDLEMMREEESDTQNEKADEKIHEKTDETKEIQGDIKGKRQPVEVENYVKFEIKPPTE